MIAFSILCNNFFFSDTNSISPKTELTPETDRAEEDDESSNSGSIREAITSNGEITSSITSTGTTDKETSQQSKNLRRIFLTF